MSGQGETLAEKAASCDRYCDLPASSSQDSANFYRSSTNFRMPCRLWSS
jgi:hypothetical protein